MLLLCKLSKGEQVRERKDGEEKEEEEEEETLGEKRNSRGETRYGLLCLTFIQNLYCRSDSQAGSDELCQGDGRALLGVMTGANVIRIRLRQPL